MTDAGKGTYPRGEAYAARLRRLAESGMDMHGEAGLCSTLVDPPARVLDAGCGTGRVAARLAELGYRCVGADVDPSMLAVAREIENVVWIEADLTTLDLAAAGETEPFDLAVAAGNVVPLVPDPAAAIARVAAHLAPGGLLVAGFGLARSHLPGDAAVVDLADFDAWCSRAGLALLDRLATWDGAPYAGGPYAVSICRRG
ncbi:MAG: class I SAM-dependent methyltransferase [Sporichthyaceae bacterium]